MAKSTCSVPGCDSIVNARGLCGGHYMRWRTTGDVRADVPLTVLRPRAGRICTIKDCGKPESARGWCHGHYRKWRLYGDPLASAPAPARKGIYSPRGKHPLEWITCKGCAKRALVRLGGKGYCSKECAHRNRTGPDHKRWRGDDASYYALHGRVYRARGKADHCERCGKTGPGRYEWANLTGNYADIWDFQQMCPACHGAYDAPVRPRGSATSHAKLTESRVMDARRRYAAGEHVTAMAAEYGISRSTLLNAIKRQTWKHVPMEPIASS